MTEREQIEAEIRATLSAEMDAVTLSNRLFGQFTGLFPRLGKLVGDRQTIVHSELWREAQTKLRELERLESEVLREVAELIRRRLPHARYRVRLEPVDMPPQTGIVREVRAV